MDIHYYEQVHMALHGHWCPRQGMSDGIDICAGGESVDPALIKYLAGDDELTQAIARRQVNAYHKLTAVSFGVNKDLQHGYLIGNDPQDGRAYVLHHPTGAVLKIHDGIIKERHIPYPGLRDRFVTLVEQTTKDNNASNTLPPSAEWNGQRVFPLKRELVPVVAGTSFHLIECRCESPLYQSHDHVVYLTLSTFDA